MKLELKNFELKKLEKLDPRKIDFKREASFLNKKMDENTAKSVELANLIVLGATLAHDGDHFYQAYRWKYRIPLQLLAINLSVYVMPAVSEFLVKNKRSSATGLVMAEGIITSAAFLKVHLWKPTTDIWGAWNYNYFKLNKGVYHNGQWIQGINKIDWALLAILPIATAPSFLLAKKNRDEIKKQIENDEANEKEEI